MKEEIINLFELRDPVLAREGRIRWFDAAKERGIPALVHFAEIKECRLEGPVSHAEHSISTGKLEGFVILQFRLFVNPTKTREEP